MLSCLVTHAIRGRLAPRFIFRSLTGGDIKLPTSYLLYSSVLQDTLPPPSEVGDGDNLPFAECTACAYPDEARKELDDMLFKGREHFSPSTRYNLLKWKLGKSFPLISITLIFIVKLILFTLIHITLTIIIKRININQSY